jgi:hypothetical protein
MPRERSSNEQSSHDLQMPIKDTALAMQRLLIRLRKPEELLKLHLKHYHMSPAQFRHRTSSLRLPEDVHDQYKEVVQGRETVQNE